MVSFSFFFQHHREITFDDLVEVFGALFADGVPWDLDGHLVGHGHDHGAHLAEVLGYTPVYLRYNTGQHNFKFGYEFGAPEDKMGLRASKTAAAFFDALVFGGIVAVNRTLDRATKTMTALLGSIASGLSAAVRDDAPRVNPIDVRSDASAERLASAVHVTLDDPDRRNALNLEMVEDLEGIFDTIKYTAMIHQSGGGTGLMSGGGLSIMCLARSATCGDST